MIRAVAKLAVTVLALHGVVALPSLVARLKHGRPGLNSLEIPNLARVDASVWRGGLPTGSGYRYLRSRGVEVIVDLRSESHLTERLAADSLGLHLVHVPIRDGRTPSEAQIAEINAALSTPAQIAFVHCGAGVGRTGTVIASRRIAAGVSPRSALIEAVSFGPLTLEQQVFIACGAKPRHGLARGAVMVASRLIDAPRRLWARLAALARKWGGRSGQV